MKQISLKVGDGKYKIFLNAIFCGNDISVCIFGGDKPHIGAVAVAVPRKSLKGDGSNSASASVICITGHKEDEIARSTALKISSKFFCIANVAVGIHINNASLDDLKIINLNVEIITKKLLAKMS